MAFNQAEAYSVTELSSKTLTPKNILRHELLGLRVMARPLKGDYTHVGEVVGETRNMVKILRDDGKLVMLPKNAYLFEFTFPSGERILVEGAMLVGRPEERLKKRIRRW
ncbi:MAG: ribonuclease P protein subunit [Nitrososphaerota archaeon]|nr:ribonuclease P protein subunit [Nitrososphaerota archaeon]